MTVYSHDNYIWLYLSPVLILIGVCEGFLSLIILTKKRFRDLPVFVTLITLTAVDILVFVTCLGAKWVGTMINFELNELNGFACKFLTWCALSFTQISSMLVALLSIERVVAVTGLVKNASQKIDRIGVPIIVTFEALVNLIPVSLTQLVPDPNLNLTKDDRPGIHQSKHVFQCTHPNVRTATIIDIWDACSLSIVPSIIILICNFIIIRVVRRQSAAIYKNKLKSNGVLCESDRQKKKQRSRDTRITYTLLTVTFTFCICNVPFAMMNIIRTAKKMNNDLLADLVWVFTYILTYVNNLMNFVIYCAIQPALREELFNLFRCPSKLKRTASPTSVNKNNNSQDASLKELED